MKQPIPSSRKPQRNLPNEETTWYEANSLVKSFIVKISTPIVTGTGFLFAYSGDNAFCGIATASHVVNHAHQWQQPIRIHHYSSKKEIFLKEEDRAIFLDQKLDTAAIIFIKPSIQLPKVLLPLARKGYHLNQGVEIGWVGFPVVSPQTLCFFSGRISAYLEQQEIYYVDGVAINGVSGGPAFTTEYKGKITIAGVISAYIPNRATGEPLPGLCIISDVSQLQFIVKEIKSLREAKEKETAPNSTL